MIKMKKKVTKAAVKKEELKWWMAPMGVIAIVVFTTFIGS